MPAIRQSRTLTKDDLNVYLYLGGTLTDPYSISFTLKDNDGNIIGLPNMIPIKFETGCYYAPWTVPDDEPMGVHTIEWRYKQTALGEEKLDIEQFEVVAVCVGEKPIYPDFVMYLIKNLRIKLRDINPDRDYSIAGEEEIILNLDNKEEIKIKIKDFYNIIYK